MPEKFEFEGGVLHTDVKDAVAQVFAFRELGANITYILRPTVEKHLLVHQMLFSRLAHKLANQFLQALFVFVTHWVMVMGYRLLVIEAGL